jgi:ABC-2 type transport system permease protein
MEHCRMVTTGPELGIREGRRVAGRYELSADDVLLFSGSFMFVNSLYVSLFLVNLIVTLPNGIRNGTLDLLMTKPISLQFYISTYFIEIPTIVAGILGGIVMIIAAVIRLGLHLNPLTLLGYVFFLFNSVFTMYLFMFLLHLFSFTAVRVGALHEIASSLSDMNRIPVSAYGKVFRNIFIYTIPILLFGNPAPMFLTGRLSVPLGLWSVFVTILLFILSRVLWKAALRRYSSANG